MKDDDKKDLLENYIENLQTTSYTLDTIVDFEKVRERIDVNKLYLEKLNYLICDNEVEFNTRLKKLFDENPEYFKCIPLLIGSRSDRKIMHLDEKGNMQPYLIDDFTKELDKIIEFFISTKLLDEILNKRITDFIQYAIGIEVGLYSNARKNQTGSSREKYIYDLLIKELKAYKKISIEKQVTIKTKNPELNKKKFDFLISNDENGKKILIECSFYNAGGSKVSETCRAYKDLFQLIKENTDYNFIWLADGWGMSTIKNPLREIINKGYLCNTHDLINQIKKIIL